MKVMKPTALLTAILAISSLAHAAPKSTAKPTSKVLVAPSLSIPAQSGTIRITPIFHGSLQIEYGYLVIHIDPFSMGNYSSARKANLVFITHDHADHLDQKAINNITYLKTSGATFFAPPKSAAVLKPLEAFNDNVKVWTMSEENDFIAYKYFESEIEIERVPAYNLKRGPKSGQMFHPKGVGNGYVLTMGGKRIYVAGDTEFVPEMKNLKNIDVAFLPMNLPYTMAPLEAAQAVKAFRPKIAVPYHYRYPFNKVNTNPQQFAAALKGSGTQVKLLKWYPGE
jgi:L-ascorbate metabolism protein UlaG (beta-lactamase superfamily)